VALLGLGSTRPDHDAANAAPSTLDERWRWECRAHAGAAAAVERGRPEPRSDCRRGGIRLFFGSNRNGTAAIWTLSFAGGVPGPASPLTNHPAGDFAPAAVLDATGKVWLFWHSSRRGPSDIWQMTVASGNHDWSLPERVIALPPPGRAVLRYSMPAAVVDAGGVLNLFCSADYGDRSRILQTVWNGSTWSQFVDISSGAPLPNASLFFRDETPSVALVSGNLWAFWQSNRDQRWRVWASQFTGGSWSAPFAVTKRRSDQKEPAAFVENGTLRVLFRTQLGGEAFLSRTVDTKNLGQMKRGQVDDRWHYVYDTSTGPNSLYARNTVGLYLLPIGSPSSPPDIQRVTAFAEPFRPLNVRYTWSIGSSPT